MRPPGRIAALFAGCRIVMPLVRESFEYGVSPVPLIAENKRLRAIGDHHQRAVFDLHELSLQTA
jgi:hypothetical protein